MDKNSATSGVLQTQNRFEFGIGSISLFALLVMVFIMGLVKIYSFDLGFHLKSAEWMLHNKKFIYTDAFSYGSDGHANYDMQWLYQLLVFFLYKMGQPVLVIVNALLITFSIALTWFRFSKYSTTVPAYIKACLFALMALFFVQPLTFEIRPHVFSWIYLNLIMLVLESYKKGKYKSIFFLPVIMLFWVNTHSLSILGLVTIGIYNVGLYFENKQIEKRLLLFSGFALGAFLINPYFVDGLLFPFKQFGLISGNGLTKSYIGEFHSPFSIKEIEALGKYYFTNPLLLIHLSAIIVIVCLLRSIIQKKYTDTLLMAAYLFILNLGIKNYGYYLMVCLPLTTRYITNWLELRLIAKQKIKTSSSQKKKKQPGKYAYNSKF
ncbi:hypothetical protein [Ferruginibacter albus]|uniref:hypothetical protein n=1 Tax=Ferruginibacter albus TaxID=2875540 RepID=UPI001CC54F1F|nr:hypothetical protein [Ferruginibacter albus]UAY51316.1 hypothetical protein K9M53_12030 [Ferruginibacter albus]